MRPVEQVLADLKKAEEAANQANSNVAKYRTELFDMYNELGVFLGITKEPSVDNPSARCVIDM